MAEENRQLWERAFWTMGMSPVRKLPVSSSSSIYRSETMEIANKIWPNPDSQMIWAGVFRKASLQSLLVQVPLFLGGSWRSHWRSHWNTVVFYSLLDQMSLSIITVFVLRLKGKVAFPAFLFWNLKDCFLSVIPNVGDSQAPEFGMASSVVMRTWNMVWAEFRLNWPRKGILLGSHLWVVLLWVLKINSDAQTLMSDLTHATISLHDMILVTKWNRPGPVRVLCRGEKIGWDGSKL